MFDLQATDGSVRRVPFKSPVPVDVLLKDPAKAASPTRLRTTNMHRLHRAMLDTYYRELERQAKNREEMAKDEDCYDNEQWSDEDAAVLEERGQAPLVYNVVSASIDWITGTERRSRTDSKVLPRRKEEAKPAERKTQLLKYLSDVNRTPFDISRAFEDAVKVGVGWIEDGVQADDDGEPIYSRYESWRNVLHDSSGSDFDINRDGRYQFRTKWLDLDVAAAMFPKHRRLLQESVAASNSFSGLALDEAGDEAMDAKESELDRGGTGTRAFERSIGFDRPRLRAIEAWIKMPVQSKKIAGGPFAGELYDEMSPGHTEPVDRGEAEVRSKVVMRMFVAIFTEGGMLYFGPSPYRHNRFPLTPIWGFRRGRTGLPYGLIRRLRDLQDDINKRASKAQWLLSANRIIMDEGAVEDIDEFHEEAQRPDAVLVKRKGYEVKFDNEGELSQFQLQLMQQSIQLVQSATGVNEDNLGRQTNAQSGIAIQRRQDQGSMTTVRFFDNLVFAQQVRGESQLSLVEQFMDERKAFRITNMRGTPDYIEVNDGLPENDIVRCKSDFVITDSEWRASQRQAAVASLLEAMSKFPPDVVLIMLDLLVENMDLPNREEIVRRIRAFTGQRDPDATELTPEEQAQQQAAAADKKLQAEQIMAQLRDLLAKAAVNEAKADDIRAGTVQKHVSTQNAALDAAGKAIALPATTHVADHIMAESGFVAQSDRARQQQPGGWQAQPGLTRPQSTIH